MTPYHHPPPQKFVKREENMKWERMVLKISVFDTLPPPTPTLGIKNQNKGMEDILDIDSHCPYLLSGETTFH